MAAVYLYCAELRLNYFAAHDLVRMDRNEAIDRRADAAHVEKGFPLAC
jgi:hypothetical protein